MRPSARHDCTEPHRSLVSAAIGPREFFQVAELVAATLARLSNRAAEVRSHESKPADPLGSLSPVFALPRRRAADRVTSRSNAPVVSALGKGRAMNRGANFAVFPLHRLCDSGRINLQTRTLERVNDTVASRPGTSVHGGCSDLSGQPFSSATTLRYGAWRRIGRI
jgi:hypothetical protein